MLQIKQLEEMGQRIRSRRKEMKMTQAKTAALLKISLTHYRNIEHGTACMSLPTFLDICEKMELDATYILTGRDIVDNPIIRLYNGLPHQKRLLLDQALYCLYKLYEE